MAIRHHFPVDAEYVIRIRLQRNAPPAIGNYVVLGLDEPHQLDVRLDGKRIKVFKVGGERKKGATQAEDEAADAGLEVRIPVQAGTRLVGVAFLDQSVEPEGVYQPPVTDYSNALNDGLADTEPAVGSVTIDGPYDAKGVGGETPSRRRIFVCHPNGSNDELSCARKILSVLARHAYRGPVPDQDLQS